MSHRSPVPPFERPPLLPPEWQELAPLIDVVLDAAPERRAVLLLELCPGDPDRRRALERMVAECERNTPLFDRPAAERFSNLARESPGCLLPELVADRYRTGRELGRGGMARVYLARDLKHGRDVAIKVIRPELSASLGHDRFLRETEIAARLRHPNIVPLYDSGEVGGSLYFVMPYEEGSSLRERLAQDGALPIADVLNVLRDVARALCYAHEHGVVHRDVKPDNVMMSGGAAVVTDFGIAKAVSAALTDGANSTLTQTGSAIGTPAYMAPEQAVGDPSTDHRADIYSFGCLAYELLTGKPPFHGLPTHEVIAGHVGTVPPPVTALRADTPAGVSELIGRCLEKTPVARPQSARELLSALDGVATTGGSAPAVAQAVSRRRRPLFWAVLTSAVVVFAAVGYLVNRNSGPPAPITLAVLPFGNTAADTSIEFVAAGLADEVASVLAKVPGIQIKSRIGARAYKGRLDVEVAEAGARLKAEYVMQGVLRQDRGHWILSAYMERAQDAATLWDSTFDVGMDQQTRAAEAIAQSLISGLRKRFPKSVGAAPARAVCQTANIEAHGLYMRGQEKLSRRGQSVMESADLFEKAVRLDGRYACAYSGLSMALALSTLFPGGGPAKDVYERVLSSAGQALTLDSTLSLPHVALAMAYQHNYEWGLAAAEYKRAIALDPRDVEARIQYGRHLGTLGFPPAEAIRQFQVARAEDPASAAVRANLAGAYALDLQLDSALAESKRALEYDPNSFPALGTGSVVRLAKNLPKEARELAERAPEMPSSMYVIAKSGDSARARQLLRELDASTPQPWLAETKRAFAYLGLGDTAKALLALERATEGKEIWPSVGQLRSPMYDSIRQSARFQALLRRVGLAAP